MKYDAVCMDCVSTFEYFKPIAERLDVPACAHCGSANTRKVILSAPQGCVKGKFEPFKSQLDGTIISTNRELDEHNKRNRVCLLGEGFSNDDILEGRCVATQMEKPDKKEIAKDIVEAIRSCESGYKPVIQSEGAEL